MITLILSNLLMAIAVGLLVGMGTASDKPLTKALSFGGTVVLITFVLFTRMEQIVILLREILKAAQ